MLDTEVFFSQRLVGDSRSEATRFRRVFELLQEVFSLRLCIRNLAPFFSFLCNFSEALRVFFYFRSHSRSRVLTASGQFTDAACGDTVCIVDTTPYQVVRVVPSTNSVKINPAFNGRRRSFFVSFPALWTPPKPVTELIVNTDLIQKCNLCSPAPPPVLPEVMDVSTNTTSPLTSTVGSITDSVEHREVAALLREADELERLEEQLNERSNQLDRQQRRLTHMTSRVNQLLLENETMRRKPPVPPGGHAQNQQNR